MCRAPGRPGCRSWILWPSHPPHSWAPGLPGPRMTMSTAAGDDIRVTPELAPVRRDGTRDGACSILEAVHPVTCPVIVGRDSELAGLESRVVAARAGRGGVVV